MHFGASQSLHHRMRHKHDGRGTHERDRQAAPPHVTVTVMAYRHGRTAEKISREADQQQQSRGYVLDEQEGPSGEGDAADLEGRVELLHLFFIAPSFGVVWVFGADVFDSVVWGVLGGHGWRICCVGKQDKIFVKEDRQGQIKK